MDAFQHSTVVAHFLAGNRVDVYAVDGIPDDGDAEHYRPRSILAVVRLLQKADPSIQVYKVAPPV